MEVVHHPQSTLACRRGQDGTTGFDLGVGGERCRPDAGSGDYGEVLKRQCPRQLREGESLRSQDKAGERFDDAVASHDQREWNEGNRDPFLPFTGERTQGRERKLSVKLINFMEQHLDEGMERVLVYRELH